MRIQSQKPPTPPQAPKPPETPQPKDETPPTPTEKYTGWEPLQNAAIVGAAIAIPSALGAVENSLFGPNVAGALTAIATPAVFGIGVGAWAYKSSKKDFNGHPILVGMTTLLAGGAAAAISPFLKMPGAAWGWQGAAIATGVGATLAGAATAIAIYKSTHPPTNG